MKTNHTPGPWQLWRQGVEIQSDPDSEYFGHEVAVNINGIPCGLCCVPITQTASNHGEPGVLHISKSESLANARLMAAAPELLAALEYLIDQVDANGATITMPGVHIDWLDTARSAISRATQEAPQC